MLLLSALISQTQAQYYFEYSPLTKEAYTKITSLRFAEGRVLIDSLKRAEPNNLCVYHIENYIDFFSIFINEEQAEFEALELNKNARLDMIRKGPKDSPYLLFCEAEIHLQWALARLKDNYKWGLKLIGRLDGTIAQGKSELEEVLAYSLHHDFIFAQETQVIYAFLLLHLDNKSDLAWQTIQQADLDPSYNPLACFAMANIAMRSGRSEEALEILRDKPSGEAYLPFYYLDLLHGYALLYKLDPSADVYIETYLNNYRGVNLIKDAYQKLAWYYLVHGNTIAYQNNMRLCKIRGNTLVDSDKSAMKEALKEDIPNTTLLSARLLFDGGYYQEAKEMLMATPVDTYEQTRDRLEYAYRLGRINHALLDIPEAIHHYNYSIAFGINAPYFYACNAALQCGTIYESLHELKEAKRYFDLCLSMNPEDYKTSLHQKAKAGLNRLKEEDKQIK